MRMKNALTEYHVGPYENNGAEVEYKRLAKWVSEVTDDSEEEVEGMAFYDGDGTPEDDVITVKKTYTFTGMYDDEDAAMKFIADLEFETGEGRKIMFKQVRTNGDVFEGGATVKEIKVTGGEAAGYPLFECAISWDKKPEVTVGTGTDDDPQENDGDEEESQ